MTQVPQEAINAWVDYDPPSNNVSAPIQLRHAFMAGFLAANAALEEKDIRHRRFVEYVSGEIANLASRIEDMARRHG